MEKINGKNQQIFIWYYNSHNGSSDNDNYINGKKNFWSQTIYIKKYFHTKFQLFIINDIAVTINDLDVLTWNFSDQFSYSGINIM